MDSKPLPVTNSIVNIKSGHKIELNCNVQGGNPKPAEIIYTKNGQNIGTGSQAFIFVTHEDQNAILGCSAKNNNSRHFQKQPKGEFCQMFTFLHILL